MDWSDLLRSLHFSGAESSEMNWMYDGGKGPEAYWHWVSSCQKGSCRDSVPCPAMCNTSSRASHGSSLMNGLLTSPRPCNTQQTTLAGGSHLAWTPQTTVCPALCWVRTFSWSLEDAWVDLGWNGGQSWQSRMRAPLSLVYCVFIQKLRWEPNRELDGQSIAIKLCTFLHLFPQFTPQKCHRGKIDEKEVTQMGFITSKQCWINNRSLVKWPNYLCLLHFIVFISLYKSTS